MGFLRHSHIAHRHLWRILAAMALALAAQGLIAAKVLEQQRPPDPASPPTAATAIGDTRANLQEAFANEMNDKQRYLVAAHQADLEHYPYVARLFRACAAAEQVHADRHVHAIAWAGGEARVQLERPPQATTAEWIRTMIGIEDYEANQFYPAILARARADQDPSAVRSINFALGAERDHLRLLNAALASLDQHPAARTLYVCPYCGHTTETLDAHECPNCFTRAEKFMRVTT